MGKQLPLFGKILHTYSFCIFINGSAHTFCVTPSVLGFQPAASGCKCRFCLPTGSWFFGCLSNELYETRNRILTVSFLRSITSCVYDENPILCNFPARQTNDAITNLIRQGRRVPYIKTKLYGCSHLVDILPARARRANKVQLDFAFFY